MGSYPAARGRTLHGFAAGCCPWSASIDLLRSGAAPAGPSTTATVEARPIEDSRPHGLNIFELRPLGFRKKVREPVDEGPIRILELLPQGKYRITDCRGVVALPDQSIQRLTGSGALFANGLDGRVTPIQQLLCGGDLRRVQFERLRQPAQGDAFSVPVRKPVLTFAVAPPRNPPGPRSAVATNARPRNNAANPSTLILISVSPSFSRL